MPLKSRLFSGDKKLEAAAVSNPAHIVPGASGEHVRKLQGALMILDNATIADIELTNATYGTSTAKAVLDFKTARDIVNHSYQTKADNIVGIMTLKAMDEELFSLESDESPTQVGGRACYVTTIAPEPRRLTLTAFLAGAPANPRSRRV